MLSSEDLLERLSCIASVIWSRKGGKEKTHSDGVLEGNQLTGDRSENLSDGERLRHESLDLSGSLDLRNEQN